MTHVASPAPVLTRLGALVRAARDSRPLTSLSGDQLAMGLSGLCLVHCLATTIFFASIASVGHAPALRIGSDAGAVTLGAVGAGGDAYGLIIKGSVAASSPYDGVETTGVQIGGDAGYETLITNGIRIAGVVSSSAYEAQTSGLRLKAGAVAETIWNTGTISAASTSEGEFSARGLVIETGALVSVLNNDGAISATVAGEKGDAYAILDNAGMLTAINNTRTITAYVVATDDDYDTDDDNTDVRATLAAIEVPQTDDDNTDLRNSLVAIEVWHSLTNGSTAGSVGAKR